MIFLEGLKDFSVVANGGKGECGADAVDHKMSIWFVPFPFYVVHVKVLPVVSEIRPYLVIMGLYAFVSVVYNLEFLFRKCIV